MAGRVRCVEEQGAVDGLVVRLALRHDQLGGLGRHHDRRDGSLGEGRPALRVLRIDEGEEVDGPRLRHGLHDLLEIRVHRARDAPRPGHGRRRHPAVEEPQVVGAELVLQDERMRVHDPLVGGPRDRPVGRSAVDQDEDRRGRREDDPGRVVLERLRLPLGLRLPHRQRRLETVQLDRADLREDVLLEELLVGRFLARGGRESDLLDAEVLERHLARALVHLRVRRDRGDAEDRLGLRRRLDADRGVRFQPAAVPGVQLRQVEVDRRLARLDHAGPVRRARSGAARRRPRGGHRRTRAPGSGLGERAPVPGQHGQGRQCRPPADGV